MQQLTQHRAILRMYADCTESVQIAWLKLWRRLNLAIAQI